MVWWSAKWTDVRLVIAWQSFVLRYFTWTTSFFRSLFIVLQESRALMPEVVYQWCSPAPLSSIALFEVVKQYNHIFLIFSFTPVKSRPFYNLVWESALLVFYMGHYIQNSSPKWNFLHNEIFSSNIYLSECNVSIWRTCSEPMNKLWDIRSNYYTTVLWVAAAQWAKWSFRGNNSESFDRKEIAQYNFIWIFENSSRSVKLSTWIVGRWQTLCVENGRTGLGWHVVAARRHYIPHNTRNNDPIKTRV